MSASMLYHTNQISNIQFKNVEYFQDKVVFVVIFCPKEKLCPCCGYDQNCDKGTKIRKLRMAPMGNKPCFLSVKINRLKCLNCSHVWWPHMPFVRGKRRVTLSFENYVIELMRFATIKHVAKFLKTSWGLIKNIHKDYLKREYKGIDYKALEYIGVDEFSIRKGHEYMTSFIDLKTGQIIHVVEGKSMSSVQPFLLELRAKAKNLRAI